MLKQKIKIILSLVIFLTFPELVFGAPSISGVGGTVSDGQSMTISGSDFGTKSPALPLLWDNFENGTSGNVIDDIIATVGDWDSGAGSDNVFYSTSNSYAGSKSASHPFTPANYNSSLSKNATSFPLVYMDFKRYLPSGAYSGNYKPWRFYGALDLLQFFAGYGCSAGLPYTGLAVYDDPSLNNAIGYPEYTQLTGQWNHYQVFYKESTAGVADGIASQYLNGIADGGGSAVITRNNPSKHISEIRIGHYMDTGLRDGCTVPDDVTVYTDNVYIDTTWSRVEIGDASTYSASTHREIQIPSTWSPSSVTITINQGTFTNGTNAYLYLFDANGEVNANGFPVVINSSDAIAPSAPTGLGVI